MQYLTTPALIALFSMAGPASTATQFSATEEAELTSSAPINQEQFGIEVAVDGDTALVANLNQFEGRVYVYVRSGTSWSEQAILTPSDFSPNGNQFGVPLDLDGDVAVLGRWPDGSAYVFRRTGTVWVEEQKLVTSNQVSDEFGRAVAIDGDTIVVGAPRFGILVKGKAHVFERSAGVWTEVQELQGSDTNKGDEFGSAVDLDGDTLAVGSIHDHAGGPALGTTYVFVRSGGTWVEQAELTDQLNWLGVSALSGERLLLGTGMIYERSGTTWALAATLVPSPSQMAASFGFDSALDGDVAVFGIPFSDGADPNDPFCESGSTSVFTFDGSTWKERHEFSPGDAACGDRFGLAVAVDGDTVLVGAPQQLVPANGKAYAFRIGPDAPVSYCTAGTSAAGCTAALQAAGTASVSAPSGFVLSAAGAEGGVTGLFFFGTSGRQAGTWGNGTSYRCVNPPVRRAGLLASGGTPGLCDGGFAQDLNALWCPTCPKPQLNPGLGTAAQVQLWYTDPASTSNQSSSLSDAVEFALGF